jgi:chemotaxis protein MotB
MTSRAMFTGLIGLGLAVLGLQGCVSKSQYDEVVAHNTRAQSELSNTLKKLQAAIDERNLLLANLKEAQERLGAKEKEVANLQEALKLFQARYEDLMKRFKDGQNAPPPPVQGIALPEQLDRLLREWAAKYPDVVEYDAQRGMVKFKTDLLFPLGVDDVSREGKAALKTFAEIIRGAEAAQFHIYVVGHTDDVPIRTEATKRMHPTNWYLSVHRAVSVMKELATGGVAEVRMGVMGFGEFHPVVANAPGHKGNAANRRVEIWIVPPERFMTISPTGAASIVPAAATATD